MNFVNPHDLSGIVKRSANYYIPSVNGSTGSNKPRGGGGGRASHVYHKTRGAIGTNDELNGVLLFFIVVIILLILGSTVFFVVYLRKTGYSWIRIWPPRWPSCLSRFATRLAVSVSAFTSSAFARFSNDRERIISNSGTDTRESATAAGAAAAGWPNPNTSNDTRRSSMSPTTMTGRRVVIDVVDSHDLATIADSARQMTAMAASITKQREREKSVKSCLGLDDVDSTDLQLENPGFSNVLYDVVGEQNRNRHSGTSSEEHVYEVVKTPK